MIVKKGKIISEHDLALNQNKLKFNTTQSELNEINIKLSDLGQSVQH